jgi:hypothetical protein
MSQPYTTEADPTAREQGDLARRAAEEANQDHDAERDPEPLNSDAVIAGGRQDPNTLIPLDAENGDVPSEA